MSLLFELDVWLMLVLILLAVLALEVRDLLAVVGILTGYSFLMALLFALLGAADVALTEAALGAALTSIFLLVAVFHTERRSRD